MSIRSSVDSEVELTSIIIPTKTLNVLARLTEQMTTTTLLLSSPERIEPKHVRLKSERVRLKGNPHLGKKPRQVQRAARMFTDIRQVKEPRRVALSVVLNFVHRCWHMRYLNMRPRAWKELQPPAKTKRDDK